MNGGADDERKESMCRDFVTNYYRLKKHGDGCRVGILARLRVIDPSFFLWTHKFQLKLTILRPLGRTCIHNGVKISHGKSLTMSLFCPPNYQNIEFLL